MCPTPRISGKQVALKPFWQRSSLLQHNFRRFNDGCDRIADFQFHLLGTPFGYQTLDQVLAYPDRYMSHDATEFDFGDFACEPIAR
jgi:hypothetical protein